MAKDSHIKSMMKGITWRILATTITVGLIYITTGSIFVGLNIGIFDLIIKLFAYYGHERIWLRFVK